jgi:hypothetical protein
MPFSGTRKSKKIMKIVEIQGFRLEKQMEILYNNDSNNIK